MGEMKPTKGAAYNKREGYSTVYVFVPIGRGLVQEVAACGPTEAGQEEQQANADLITEAFNVHHNTGLSPVQLVEMVKELKAALNRWLGTADDPNAGWRGTGGSDVLFACEHCGEKHEDCTKIDHTDDCPITLARAALAKCEGVGNG